MKKYMQKLFRILNLSKTTLIFLTGILVIGIISGSLFSVILNKTDQEIAVEYLNKFILLIENNKINGLETLLNSILFNYSYAIIIWVLGLSIIGLPIVIFMFFGKCFTLGFTISMVIKNFGLKGCLVSLGYIFPHCIINIFVFSILTLYSATLSLKLIKSIVSQKNIDFKLIMKKYLYIIFIALIGLLCTGIYEGFFMPKIFNFILKNI